MTGSVTGLVLLSERLGPLTDEERRIESAGGRLRGAPLWTHADITQNATDADILIVGAVEPFDAAALATLPNCRAVVRRGVGVDNVDVDAATELGIVVANVPDASVEEVSDHALALLLALERRIVPLHGLVRAGRWATAPGEIAAARAPARRLADLTLGVIGFGRIGQALARKGSRIYTRVLAYDPYGNPEAAVELGVALVPMEVLLAEADHVSLHMPMSPDTLHLLDAKRLAAMRRGAILVNTARGGLIDEQALTRAIGEGHIGGAGLDVSEREPLGDGDPLLTADGLILTAHSAMASTAATSALASRSVDAAIDLLAGRWPASVVNLDVLRSPLLRIGSLPESSTLT